MTIETEPTPSWSEGFATANGISPAMRGVHDRMLASILMPAGYATVVEDGKPVAYGLAVVERGMVGLFDIVTVPEARRRGVGRLLVKSLLAWGRSQGATASYLQVHGTNEAARACTAASAFRKRIAIITVCGFDGADRVPLLLRHRNGQVRTLGGVARRGDLRDGVANRLEALQVAGESLCIAVRHLGI